MAEPFAFDVKSESKAKTFADYMISIVTEDGMDSRQLLALLIPHTENYIGSENARYEFEDEDSSSGSGSGSDRESDDDEDQSADSEDNLNYEDEDGEDEDDEDNDEEEPDEEGEQYEGVVDVNEDDDENDSNEDGDEELDDENIPGSETHYLENSSIDLYDFFWQLIDSSTKGFMLHTTIFWWGCLYNIVDLLEVMIDLGVDVNCQDSIGLTALHMVCAQDVSDLSLPNHPVKLPTPQTYYDYEFAPTDLLRFLVDNKADLNAEDSYGRSPLHLASCSREQGCMIPFLLLSGAKVSNPAALRHKNILHKMLLGIGSWLRKELLDHIWREFESHFTPTVQTLMSAHAQLSPSKALNFEKDIDSQYPSRNMLKVGDGTMLKIPKKFFTKDNPVTIEEWLACHLIQRQKQDAAICSLLEAGINLLYRATGYHQSCVFSEAAANNNTTVLLALLEEGYILPAGEVFWDQSVACCTLDSRSTAAMRLLLEYGCEMYLPVDKEAVPPLIQAAGLRQLDIVQLLVDRCEDVEETHDEFTPLIMAAQHNCITVVEYLLQEAHADIHVVSKGKQRSALHVAVAGGNVSTVRMLLKYGASIEQCDENGLTVLDYALFRQLKIERRFAYPQIVVMLLEAGARTIHTSIDKRRTDHWTLMRAVQFFTQRGKEPISELVEGVKVDKEKVYLHDRYNE